jgi:alkylation response protein AidB-like acyl-CoA dehydrogenase
MLSAAQDYDMGGMQLPYTVESASNAFFAMASVSIGSGMLTTGNANLLMKHGTEAQQARVCAQRIQRPFSGTMCLSEPQAGSSLSDVVTRAVPDGEGFEADPLGPRYRLKGNKMWISAGEHELTENIIHLVLAKIPDGRQAGARHPGISLFIVPKKLVDTEGQLTGERNDVALAGLNHKCGWRGTTNTLLNFGEGKYPVNGEAGAVGYLVGQPGKGLHCMFHMMNEARIGVGMAATMLGMAGYHASLDYAKNRPQGRPMGPAGKDPAQPQVRIIEHADVKRMLLAQKSYCEGALALELYCARLVDEQHTGAPDAADDARLLLEVLTPIAKSWPSEWCLEANSLAIQVHGGYGYTRDFPGGAVLARQPPEHDPRGHARHPGHGPAGPQGADGKRQGPAVAGRAHQRHHRTRHSAARTGRARQRAGPGAGAGGRGHQGRLGHRQPARRAGQRRALHAGLRPHGAGLDLAGRGAGRPRRSRHAGPHRAPGGHALFLPLRAAQDRRLAAGGEQPRPDLRQPARGGFLMLHHVVMWKLKDHAEGADRRPMCARRRPAASLCRAGARRGALRGGTAQPGLECTYDLVLNTTFTDHAALAAYQSHPDMWPSNRS